MRWSLLAALVVALGGCGHGSSGPPTSCASRCTAYATSCKNDTSQCASVCQWISEAQLSCLEQVNCDHARVASCIPDGSAGGGGGGGNGAGASGGTSSASGGAGPGGGATLPACLGLGAPGCTNAAAGPNCCASATCDEKKGVCCVGKANMPCKSDADCCGANVLCSPSAGGGKVCTVGQ